MADEVENEPAADEDLSELEADELDDDALAGADFVDDDDDADVEVDVEVEVEGDDDDEDDEDDDDEEYEETAPRVKRRRADDDEDDEDEDLLAPDDVEADLDRILKDRMVATDDDEEDDEEDDIADDVGDRADGTRRLQPKRADEQLCNSCFLLVRASAPGCPVADDDCPIFS